MGEISKDLLLEMLKGAGREPNAETRYFRVVSALLGFIDDEEIREVFHKARLMRRENVHA